MKFFDKTTIKIKSGNGGSGCVSFLREKYITKGGPNGGNGGKGGGIIIISDINTSTLIAYKHKRHFIANNGEGGKKNNASGGKGKDTILKVPIGTQVYDIENKKLLYDFTKNKEQYKAAHGGIGGIGNTCFKSSTNQAPRKALPGRPGEEKDIQLILKLISDIGLVGLPNAGKSTILSHLTNSKSKIAPYPFSTTSPHLGSIYYNYKKYTIADIPGIISGSTQGIGLGCSFLKHIERCSVIIYIIDITSCSAVNDYIKLNKELCLYSDTMKKKQKFICLSKTDLISKCKNTTDNIINITHHIKYKPYFVNHNKINSMYKMVEDVIKKTDK